MNIPISFLFKASRIPRPRHAFSLAVTATAGDAKGFAARLEAARRRSGQPVVIEHLPADVEPPANERKQSRVCPE
jgi:hypothetical protein